MYKNRQRTNVLGLHNTLHLIKTRSDGEGPATNHSTKLTDMREILIDVMDNGGM